MASIIVTVGPKSIKPEILEKLVDAGANSFRINLSHSNKENLHKYFAILNKSGISPAIDTQGAQLRVVDTNIKNKLNPGNMIKLIFGVKNRALIEKDDLFILLNHPEAFEQISEDDIMKVDFDGLALQINRKVLPYLCIAEVLSSGSIVMNRAVDINSKSLNLSTLTEFDKYAIEYAISNGSKEIYASFISSASDVNYVRNLLGDNVSLISKIETSLGVSNVKEIMNASDKILIDRGDLSREITIPSVPLPVFNI